MSYVTNILLTARCVPHQDKAKIEAIELDGRAKNGQHFHEVPHEVPGGFKAWEAHTWMAAVNYARDIDDIRRDIGASLSYGSEVTLVVHHEDPLNDDDLAEVWWYRFERADGNHTGQWVSLAPARVETPT